MGLQITVVPISQRRKVEAERGPGTQSRVDLTPEPRLPCHQWEPWCVSCVLESPAELSSCWLWGHLGVTPFPVWALCPSLTFSVLWSAEGVGRMPGPLPSPPPHADLFLLPIHPFLAPRCHPPLRWHLQAVPFGRWFHPLVLPQFDQLTAPPGPGWEVQG